MDQKTIELPRIVLYGEGVIGRVSEVCSRAGLKEKPLVLMDRNTKAIAGDRVLQSLSGLLPASFIVEDSTQGEVERILSANSGFSGVISVGGGVVIDVGKMAAFNSGKPFISIPTALSHDGIASERASLTNGGVKVSLRAEPPFAVIADTEILGRAPYRLTASGCADVISNITAVHDWKLATRGGDNFSFYASNLALMSAEIVIESAEMIKSKEERGIRNLFEALLASSVSMSIAKSSSPASGSEHSFSHAMENVLTTRNLPHPLHGEQVGVGAILMALHQGGEWERIRDALKRVGAPTTAEELGVDVSVILESLLKARDVRDRHTILNEKPLTEEAAKELILKTGVGKI